MPCLDAPRQSVQRLQKLYRWQSVVIEQASHRQLHLYGMDAPGDDAEQRSGPIVSLEMTTLRAMDRSGRHYQLLSPRSLEAVSDLKRALASCRIRVTWHGLPYRWLEGPAAQHHAETPANDRRFRQQRTA